MERFSKLSPMEMYILLYNGKLPTETDPDYLELLRMSKYRIKEIPDFSPGKCANCGSAKEDGRKYIDFGLMVDWYGTVFLCGYCVKNIATEMLLFQPLINEIGKLKHELLNLRLLQQKGEDLEDKILHTFKEVKEYFESLHSNLPATSDSSSVGNVTSMVDEEATAESVPDETKQRSSKPSTSSRPSSVPGLKQLLTAGED